MCFSLMEPLLSSSIQNMSYYNENPYPFIFLVNVLIRDVKDKQNEEIKTFEISYGLTTFMILC